VASGENTSTIETGAHMEQIDSTLSSVTENWHFWERAGARLPVLLKKHASEFEKWLVENDLLLSSALVMQISGTTANEFDSRQFEDALLNMLGKNACNKRQVISWLQIAYTVIASLNAKGLKLHQVRLAVDIRPTKSPFVRGRVSQIAQVENWRSVFFQWLKIQHDSATPEQWRAAALLCSALCGCLLDFRKLVVLVNQINRPIKKVGELAYFDFQLPYRNLPGSLLQRWFPDPLTEMLLLRAQQQNIETTFDAKRVRRLIFNFLKEMGVEKLNLPKSPQKFTDSLSVYHESKATQIDIRFASGHYVSQSLKHEVWLRLNDCASVDQINKNQMAVGIKQAIPIASAIIEDNDLLNEQDQPSAEIELIAPWFFELSEQIDQLQITLTPEDANTKKIIQAAVGNFNLQPPFEYARPYLQWLCEMVNGKTSTGDAFQTSTILKYFNLVVPALIAAFGTETPSKKDAEELVEAYGNILESFPLGLHRTSLAKGLRELHFFLVRQYGCEGVDAAETFGKEAEVTVVEARIISVDEYREADDWLRKKMLTGVAPTLIEAARLVFMLAFRLGMRRMEIMMLKLSDLHSKGDPDLLVRPHTGRRLKSMSSKRRMPLAALLETDELDRLLKWAEYRHQQELLDSNSECLFVLPSKEHIPIERTVGLIHEAMRVSSGDNDLHMHHLRHSFASWTYLKLRLVSHPDLLHVFKHLPLTYQYLQNAHNLRSQLLPGNSSPSRSDAYCVSRLLGHSGPNVSMNHYIHFGDLLVYGCARRDVSNVDRLVLVSASGLLQRNAYRHLNNSMDSLLKAARNKWQMKHTVHLPATEQRKGSVQHSAESKSSRKSDQGIKDFKVSLDKLRSVLHLYDNHIQDVDIARELNMSIDVIRKFIELTKPLALQLGIGDFKDGKCERIAPPKVNKGSESSLYDDLVSAVYGLLQKNSQLLMAGLRIYFDCFNRQKKDVVFKGEKDIELAKIYLAFLKQIGISTHRIQLVVRSNPDNTESLEKWKGALNLPDTIKVKYVASPNITKATYSSWLGIQIFSTKGRSHHVFVGGVFMLIKVVVDSSFELT
jgi:integrase